MTLDELAQLVDRFSYKPGWEFRAGVNLISGLFSLEVKSMVQDRDRPESVRPLTLTDWIPGDDLSYFNEPQVVVHHLCSMVRRMELHEVDEWLRLDGKLIKDPHAP